MVAAFMRSGDAEAQIIRNLGGNTPLLEAAWHLTLNPKPAKP